MILLKLTYSDKKTAPHIEVLFFCSENEYAAGNLQLQAGEKSIGLFILGNGLVDDILGKLVIAVGIGLEPVADKLLIEGRLAVAGLIALCGPEPWAGAE